MPKLFAKVISRLVDKDLKDDFHRMFLILPRKKIAVGWFSMGFPLQDDSNGHPEHMIDFYGEY